MGIGILLLLFIEFYCRLLLPNFRCGIVFNLEAESRSSWALMNSILSVNKAARPAIKVKCVVSHQSATISTLVRIWYAYQLLNRFRMPSLYCLLLRSFRRMRNHKSTKPIFWRWNQYQSHGRQYNLFSIGSINPFCLDCNQM